MPDPGEPVGISLSWTIQNTGNFSWSFTCVAPAAAEAHYSPICRRYKGTLFHFSLHQPCTHLATCFVSAQSPLQATHFSLSALPQWQMFCTSSHSSGTSLGFSHMLSDIWKLFLSQDQVKWRGCPMSSAMCPSEQASQENSWISAALGLCCTPKHHSPGSYPHGRSLANCSSSCIWEIDFNSPARECNILITSVDKVCCSHSDLDLRDK